MRLACSPHTYSSPFACLFCRPQNIANILAYLNTDLFGDIIRRCYSCGGRQVIPSPDSWLTLFMDTPTRRATSSIDPALLTSIVKGDQQAFSQLLSPKTLLQPDSRKQQLKYSSDSQELNIDTLSSGEREVVNIVFDFLLRNPSDCIVIFDEPELHLHPELSYKLLQTLRTVGENNQFIFCTHSADIITASLDQSVIFIPLLQP